MLASRRWVRCAVTLALAGAALCALGGFASADAKSLRARIRAAALQSNERPPKVGHTHVRAVRRRAVVRFDVYFPGIGRGRSRARTTITAVSAPNDHGKVLATRRWWRRPPDRRTKTFRVVFTGRAGRMLARAERRHHHPLRLLQVNVDQYRDLGGSKATDHVWRAQESGHQLAGDPKISVGNTTMNLLVQAPPGDDTYVISSGDMTCASGASGALNGMELKGGYYASEEISENNSGIVATSLGVGKNQDTAATLWSPEARTFAFEMKAQYDVINLTPPRADLRYANVLDPMSDRQDPCALRSTQNSFVLAADDVDTGAHTAEAFQFKRDSSNLLNPTMDWEPLTNGVLSVNGLWFGNGRTNATSFFADINHSAPTPNLNGPCPDGATWMACEFPPGSPKESRPLSQVAFPGSHDSATPALDIENNALESNTTGGCSGYNPVMHADMPLVRNWAVSQNLNLREQLDEGIRYLDMRAAYDGHDWRAIHTIYSQAKLQQDVQTIATWAKQHPDEVVVVDFNHVCPLHGGDVNQLLDILSTPDPHSDADLCNTAYKIRTAAHPDAWDLPSRTVADVRGGSGNVIVLLDQPGGSTYNDAVLQSCGFAVEQHPNVSGPAFGLKLPNEVQAYDEWPDVEGPPPGSSSYASCANDSVSQILNSQIEQYPYQSSPSITDYRQQSVVPFMQTQLIYTLQFSGDTFNTPNALISGDLLANALGGKCPGQLMGWEAPLMPGGSPLTKADILAQWGTNTNMVITDQADNAYVSQVVNLNGGSAARAQTSRAFARPKVSRAVARRKLRRAVARRPG